MRLEFGPDDEDSFFTARTDLLERFERWLVEIRVERGGDAAELAGNAGLALDWKWSYGDGDLGRWRTDDIAEFLLDWCPRKLSMSPADCVHIPRALAAFTTFLESEGLLAGGSSPAAALADAATGLTDQFVTAMGDSSNFGVAKSLFGAAGEAGVDLTDPDQLQQWIDQFTASPEQDRRRIIPDTALARRPRPALPPVALPDDTEVAASKEAAPILATFAAFATYVGDGRKLTQTGNLSLADARALVPLLHTGDIVDEQIDDRTYKTRSSTELPRLRLIFAWARKAGVVRVAHGRVIATKQGAALSKHRAAFFDRSVDALMALGPLTAQRSSDHWMAWPQVDALLDELVVQLLAGPYVTQSPLPLDDLISIAVEAVHDAFQFTSLGDEIVSRRVATDVIDIFDALALAGVVRRVDAVEPDDDLPVRRRRHGGTVEMTDAGVVTTQRLLIAAGYDAPAAGRFAQSTATELFLGTDLDDFPTLLGELAAWRRQRDPAEAAAELATAVRELHDPGLRNMAMAAMGDLDLEVAAPEVRRLAAEPETRGFASCWLVDHGLDDPSSLYDPGDLSSFVDALAQRFVTAGAGGLCDTLALAGDHDAQITAIGQLWRSPSAATDTVLAAIGEVHPTKAVAKAARKARFQRRSWLGGLRQ